MNDAKETAAVATFFKLLGVGSFVLFFQKVQGSWVAVRGKVITLHPTHVFLVGGHAGAAEFRYSEIPFQHLERIQSNQLTPKLFTDVTEKMRRRHGLPL